MFSIVISAPSGAGKTTIIRRLLENNAQLAFSVSTTTRPERKGEKAGIHYYHVSRVEFEKMIAEEAFVEWAEVHDNYYGTTKKEIDRIKGKGRIPIFDVDVQGAGSLKEKLSDALFVFIVPPSLQILESRLRSRKTDSDEQIMVRLQNARKELQQHHLFEYIIINDNLDEAVEKCSSIITAEKCKIGHNKELIENLGGYE